MSGRLKLAYLAIFTILLALAPATALTESFSIDSTNPVINACSCGLFTNKMFVRNTGDIPSTYSISQEGSAIAWSNLLPNAFNLDPMGSQEITDYLNIPCSAQGTYTLTTKAETQFGTSKALQQAINVGQCQNAEIIVKRVDPENLCACTPVTYLAEITNVASFEDTFFLKTNKEGISLSADSVTLQPGEKQTVYLYANLPCNVYGDQDFRLSVNAKNSGYTDSTIVPLKIKSCYNYAVSAPKEMLFCNAEKQKLDVTIFNLDQISNSYTLTANKYVTFTNGSKIFLWQYTNGTVPAEIGALKPGKYNITIDAEPERGDIGKSGVVQLDVQKCNSADISISKRQDNLVSCENAKYDVVIRNDGTQSNTYNLYMTAPSWARLEATSAITLLPGTEQIVPLSANVPCDFTGDAQIRINTTVSGRDVGDRSVLDIKSYSKEDAYRIDVDVKPTTIYYKNEEISITFEHSGIRAATYQLAVKGPPWVSLETDMISLEPGKTKTVNLKTNPSKSVKEGTFRIEVSAKPAGENIGFVKVFDLPLRTAPWYVKTFDLLNKYKWYILIGTGALLALLILFYIIRRFARYVKRKREEKALRPAPLIPPTIFRLGEAEKKRSWPWTIFWILMIAALLFGGLASYYYFTQYKQPVTPLISIDRQGLSGFGNTIIIRGFAPVKIALLLNNPFNDTLAYDLKIENTPWVTADRTFVEIEPKGSEKVFLSIYPDQKVPDGQYKLRISARLPKENKVYTESLNIILQRFGPWYERYLPYIIAGFVALALLLSLLALFKKKKFDESRLLSDLDKKHAIDKSFTLVEKKERSWRWLWVLVAILLILAGLAGAIYLAGQLAGVGIPAPKPSGNVTKSIISINGTGIQGVEVQGSVVIIRGTQNVTIPMIMQNSDEGRAIYDINFSRVPWLKVDKSHIELDEQESEVVNLFVEPIKAAGKRFEVKIATKLVDQNLVYNEAIVLDIRSRGVRSLLDTLRAYWTYITSAFGALLLVGIISSIIRRNRKTGAKELISEIASESKGKNLNDLKEVHSPKKPVKTHTKIGLRK